MCLHRLSIYTTCGHSFYSQQPLLTCQHAEIAPSHSYSQTCEIIAHPYQSWKLERLCPTCETTRRKLMGELESKQEVKYDEWRWKVSYGVPAHAKDGGKDSLRKWEGKSYAKGRNGDEEDRREEKRGSKRKSKRFSWRRRRTRVEDS